MKVIYSDGNKLPCPLCGKIMKDNGFRERLINKVDLVFLQRYKCKSTKCGFDKVTNIDHFVPKGCNYEISLRNEPILLYKISYMSLEKMSEVVYLRYQTKPSRQTILNFLNNEGEEYLENEGAKLLNMVLMN